MTEPTPLKVLLYDIETAPLLAHIWHPADDYVPHERLIHDNFMLCWSAKWLGDKRIISARLTPAEARNQDDERIVSHLAELVREADVVIAHNIDGFDRPVLNQRLMQMELEPLGPTRTLDTLKLAKREFRTAYKKLDYLGEFLGLGKKIKTDFELWRRCYLGEAKALREMQRYNKRDVDLLEKVFERLRPYVRNLPRLVEATHANQHACPSCGSILLVKRGYYRTQASTFVKFRCSSCGRYSRQRTSERKRLSVHPL